MTVDTIVIGTIAILLLGLAIYLWIDRKKWFKKSLQRMTQIYSLQEELKETVSLFDALDEENAELTVKCNQYEALIGERLDAIPEVDCCEVDCEKCLVGDCPYNIDKNDGVGGFSNMLNDEKDECNQEKCDSGKCCKKCASDECPDRKHAPTECFSIDCDECMVGDCIAESLMKQDSLKKPCCSCDNGVYNTTECVGCDPENSYENYTPIKY